MRFTSIDKIVRNVLLNQGKSLHWYIQYLNYAKDCLRELHFDDLKVSKTVILPVDANGVVKLPCDFVDIVRVGLPVGQYVKPLSQYTKISNLPNKDKSGASIPYGVVAEFDTGYLNWYDVNVNEHGEHIGRMFGYGHGRQNDVFKLIRERGEIQLDENVGSDRLYVEYINDGMDSDAATRVHPYAQACIESYIESMAKRHNRTFSSGDKMLASQDFDKQRRILRARMSDLTLEDIKRAMQKGYKASI